MSLRNIVRIKTLPPVPITPKISLGSCISQDRLEQARRNINTWQNTRMRLSTAELGFCRLKRNNHIGQRLF